MFNMFKTKKGTFITNPEILFIFLDQRNKVAEPQTLCTPELTELPFSAWNANAKERNVFQK